MNWLNIHTSTLRAPEFIGSGPIERATWLCVLGYSVEQENGGILRGAATWKDRQWQQTCGVTAREVKMAARLLIVDGEDIIVVFYPLEKEESVRHKREFASRGGKAKALAYAKPDATPDGTAQANPDALADASAEGNRIEGNRNNTPLPPKGDGGKKQVPTSEPARRMASMFGRRESTGWSDKEIQAFKKLGAVDLEELAIVEVYHAAEKAKGENGRHRRDLFTFLNNYRGEVDRATASRKPAKAPLTQKEPYGWADVARRALSGR